MDPLHWQEHGSDSEPPATRWAESLPHATPGLDGRERENAMAKPISRRRPELRMLLNRSLFIHKLPNKLLVQIFEYLSHTFWNTEDEDG